MVNNEDTATLERDLDYSVSQAHLNILEQQTASYT